MIAYYAQRAEFWLDDSNWNLEWHHSDEGREWRQENAEYYLQKARALAVRSGYSDPQEVIASTYKKFPNRARKGVTL